MAAEHLPKRRDWLTGVIVGALVINAFFLGSLWTRVSYIEAQVGIKSGLPGLFGALPGGQKSTVTGQAQPEQAPTNPYTRVDADSLNIPPVTDEDWIRGASKEEAASLSWIEYSDLECPFCKRIHPDLVKLLEEYPGEVRWVYRHFPLDTIHPKARKEAEAAECAGSLGGAETFWKFVDRLFEVTPSNNGLDAKELPKIAAFVGVNAGEFNACLEAEKFADKVQSQLDGGEKAGVTGTPGNFLLDDKGNAWIIPGAVPYETIKEIVDSALAI